MSDEAHFELYYVNKQNLPYWCDVNPPTIETPRTELVSLCGVQLLPLELKLSGSIFS